MMNLFKKLVDFYHSGETPLEGGKEEEGKLMEAELEKDANIKRRQ